MIQIHPQSSTFNNNLRKQIRNNTKDIANLREQIAQYQKDHPIKSPCTSCQPTIITIAPNNLEQDSDDGGMVTILGFSTQCATYRCTISIADGALDNIIAVLIDGDYAYRTQNSISALTPIYPLQYHLEKGDIDNANEGQRLYTITVSAKGVTLSNIQNSSTSVMPESIKIIFCNCQGHGDYTILTNMSEAISSLLD